MKKFYSTSLDAHNVYEVDLDLEIVNELKDYYEKNISINLNKKYIGDPDGDDHFFLMSYETCGKPDWNSDIKWISVNNVPTYQKFKKYFYKLNLDKYFNNLISFNKNIEVYQFFFVVRSRSSILHFHPDWLDGTYVNAFSLMSPLCDMSREDSIHLRYVSSKGSRSLYEYKKGKAIVFGEEFIHGTDVGTCDTQQPFLCMLFGTDKSEYLPKIFETAGRQGEYFMHPKEGFIKCYD